MGTGGGSNISGPVASDHHSGGSGGIRAANDGFGYPTLLLSGLAASAGRASGRVRILTSPNQQREFLDGEVLVAEMTSPDWVPAMRRATALITDGGGVTCHAAIVSRELQLPCVVGTGNATTACVPAKKSPSTVEPARCTPVRPRRSPFKGRPSRFRNLFRHWRPGCMSIWPLPSTLRRSLRCRWTVGLLRAEFMVADALNGVHPRRLIELGQQDRFVDAMSESLLRITRAFSPRPVVYRSIDFRTNEFRGLQAGRHTNRTRQTR